MVGGTKLSGTNALVADTLLDFLAQSKKRLDLCCASGVLSVVIYSEELRDKFIHLVKSGGKIRIIAEITLDNLEECNKLMNYCELRHVDDITESFGIGDSGIYSSFGSGDDPNYSDRVQSTSNTFVQMQNLLFESLWEKATPAKLRMAHLRDGIEPENTEVVTGWEAILQKTIDGFSKAVQQVDHCCDSNIPAKMVNTPVHQAILDFFKRGGKVRLITEITKENVHSIKELMEIQEIRHIRGFNLNFGVSENMISQPTSVYSFTNEPQCIWSNSKEVIRQHHYLFDTFWEKALPAEVRIREIEQGIAPQVIETLNDSERIQQLALKIVGNAQKEILILFSSSNAFRTQNRAGLIQLIEKLSQDRTVNIKIIAPANEKIRQATKHLKNIVGSNEEPDTISIKYFEASAQNRVSVIVVDGTYSLALESQDGSDDSLDTVGMALAMYSNSKATVLSYKSMFESMWSQTVLFEEIRRLYEQLQVQDKLQKEFMDIAAHELRSPLDPILGLTEILRRHSTNSRSRQLLEVIIRNAKKLQHLQEEILDVTKIERQVFSLDLEGFNFSQLAAEIIEDYKHHEKSISSKIKISYDSECNIEVVGDRRRINQVISNLLDNAFKFTESGIISIKTGRTSDGQLHFLLADSGRGIDPEVFPRLFTKFASRSASGTGLGLYISKAIIEAHGGKIWAENNANGVGASFQFTLPSINEAREVRLKR